MDRLGDPIRAFSSRRVLGGTVTKTYRGASLLSVAVGLLLGVPAVAAASVPASVTKALDYLHTRQRADGGFSYSSSGGDASDTPWTMLAIAAGANNPSRWKVGARSPVSFLQNINLATAAANSGNLPEYYALAILAYLAADRTDLLSNAGSSSVDLVAKLESYQNVDPRLLLPDARQPGVRYRNDGLGRARSGRRPPERRSGDKRGGGLAAGPRPERRQRRRPQRRRRLRVAAHPAVEHPVTSLVVQALIAARVATSAGGAGRRALHRHHADLRRRLSGHDRRLRQRALDGVGDRGVARRGPADIAINGHTPYTFLAKLHQVNGSYNEFASDMGDVMDATLQASIALSGKTLPVHHGANALTHFAPSFTGTVRPRPAPGTPAVRCSYGRPTTTTRTAPASTPRPCA